MARIVFIGAGSVEFTKNVLSDLLTLSELGAATLVLHDIDAGRLATAETMAHWMVDHLGLPAKVEAHTDRRAAVDGADYVINEIAVGGFAATRIDFEVPARHGLRHGQLRRRRQRPVLDAGGLAKRQRHRHLE